MNSLDKLFDICKYNRLDKAIDEAITNPKEREYSKRLIRIVEGKGVPFEIYAEMAKEIAALNQEYKGLF